MPERHLRVYSDRSELVQPDLTSVVFTEGVQSPNARVRAAAITARLSDGFLNTQILLCRDQFGTLDLSALTQAHRVLIQSLVDSVTSEVGRALVGITILQLCVKALSPLQSIRLHKAGPNRRDFSWSEGISMRSLDKNFITPVLRAHDLVRLNRDGFMMTRSLAENYPYTPVYKANMRGARLEWLQIVESVEDGSLPALPALHFMLSRLLTQAQAFLTLADETIQTLNLMSRSSDIPTKESVTNIILAHIQNSDYAARLMEIAMHSLFQALVDVGHLQHADVKPLSQMRSANKKHGNVGDIELLASGDIIEAWDAKFGKTYLRDELEELAEKVAAHHALGLVGFVTSSPIERRNELLPRIAELEDEYKVEISIITFAEWVDLQFAFGIESGNVSSETLALAWLTAYTETLAQRRKELAPIDEPSYQWLRSLKALLHAQVYGD
jgi:hypothetical protein